MDIREIRQLIEIADMRNITKAAANLFITQPALSKMLKKVESELGMPLFYRSGSVVSPTEAGLFLVEEGKKIVDSYTNLENKLHDLRSMKRGRVRLGVPPAIAAFDFPEVIMRYRRHFPDVAVEVREYGARTLESMVLDGELDVAISMHPVVSDGLSEIIIIQDHVVCAMNAEHPLAKNTTVTLEELSGYAINTFPEGFAVYQELKRKFQTAGLSPMIDVTSPTCDFLLKISSLSNEVCILPTPCINYYDRDNMLTRPLDPPFQWGLCIVYKKNSYMPDKLRVLISCIQQTISMPI